MLGVFLRIVRVDENIIEVHNDIDVEHMRENIVDEALEGSQSVSESKRHD